MPIWPPPQLLEGSSCGVIPPHGWGLSLAHQTNCQAPQPHKYSTIHPESQGCLGIPRDLITANHR